MDSKSDKAVDALGDSLEKTLLKEEEEDAKVLQLQTSEQEADQGGDKKESLLVTAEKDADKGEEEKKKKKQGPNVDQSAEKDESTEEKTDDKGGKKSTGEKKVEENSSSDFMVRHSPFLTMAGINEAKLFAELISSDDMPDYGSDCDIDEIYGLVWVTVSTDNPAQFLSHSQLVPNKIDVTLFPPDLWLSVCKLSVPSS